MESQQTLLDKLETIMTSKLETFKVEISESQKMISEAQFSRFSEISPYHFKKKGNEEQFKVNAKINMKLQEAHTSLQENPLHNAHTERASASIAEGMDIVKHRQKLIKMADSSETGWKVVEEYETNALAEDSEDEKRITRAEARAQRKIKTQRTTRQKRYFPYGTPARQHTQSQAGAADTTTAGGSRRPGLCFACGKPGHWRVDCMQKGTNKISNTFCFCVEARLSVRDVFVAYEDMLDETRVATSSSASVGNFTTVVGSTGERSDSKVRSPVGMLRSALHEWESIGACSNVLNVIRDGYRLPMYSMPDCIVLRNNKSALDNAGFVQQEIETLLLKGCIREVDTIPKVVNPLTVAGNKEKLRLVLDCRHINPCLFKYRFRYEDSTVALDLFRKGDWVFTFDLKSAYHHIEIFPDHRTFLGFSWQGVGLLTNIDEAIKRTGQHTTRTHDLAKKMAGFILKARSDKTVEKYYNAFKRWETFAKQDNVCHLPAQPVQVALYLTHILDTGGSGTMVTAAIYGIKWAHSINGFEDPTVNSFVKNLMEAAKRQVRAPRRKKDCVSADMLICLCDIHKDSRDISVVRDLAMIVLCFAGFLRYNELSELRCEDVSFHESCLKLNIRKSKTDQYRLGNEVVIAKGKTVACPYLMFKRFMGLSGATVSSKDYLFKPLFRSKAECKQIYKQKPLSYTRARECVVKRLNEVSKGLDLGLHSLRAGGATEAANGNVNERCWKRHGRWRSDVSKDGYVADSLQNRLEVTKQLGL
ncbi:uncharacterized protein [Argopecten irradians]|uniref:uncharacterized protein n=1 Tax=Argopecten irradians TaxID=31199 RepID=UPI0037234033